MPQEKSVIDELEPDPNDNEDSQSGKGDKTGDSKKFEERVNNLKAEYEKKRVQDRKEIEASVEAKVNERIKELEAKRSPKPQEEEELEKLKAAKSDPNYSVWKKLIREVSEEVADEKIGKYDHGYAISLAEEMADKEGYDVDKFKEEIVKLLEGKHLDKLPQQRVKLAAKEWKKWKDTEAKLKEAEDEKKKRAEFAETGGRTASRKPQVQEEFKEAQQTGDWKGVLSKLLDKPAK